MRVAILVCAISVFSALSSSTSAGAIIVDCNGGGDFLTIQEGVDAAASGDTVIVMPCVYTDRHDTIEYDVLNVYVDKNVTLMSSDGADATIVDGEGATHWGIVAIGDPDAAGIQLRPVIKGFTVTNGIYNYRHAAILVENAEAVENVCTGYIFGIATGGGDLNVITDNVVSDNSLGISADGALVTGNTAEYNGTGIAAGGRYSHWSAPVSIEGNTVRNNSYYGIRVNAPEQEPGIAEATLLGNTVSANLRGVYLGSIGESYCNTTLHVTMAGNEIFGNAEVNLKVAARGDNYYFSTLDLLLGGSLGDANGLYGSLLNLHAEQDEDAELMITATHNYWGSTLCADFVPLFLLENVPEPNLVFLPFTDETHTELFPVCENSAVSASSWGRIKALYQ